MANIKSSAKRARTAEKKRRLNKGYRSTMKTKIRRFERSLEQGSSNEEIQTYFRDAKRYIDKVASKCVIHKNTAARKKSQLEKRFNDFAAS